MSDTDPAEGPPDKSWLEKWSIPAAILLIVLGIVIWHDRISADFWPLDSSRVGPNLVASIIWALAAVLLYPPWRRAFHKFVDRKLAPVHEHLKVLHKHHDDHAAALDEIHRHLSIGKYKPEQTTPPVKKAAVKKK